MLTDREEAFIAAYLLSGDHKHAAQTAGYAHPAIVGRKILERPQVRERVAASTLDRLKYELAPVGVSRLADIIKNGTNRESLQGIEILRKWITDTPGGTGDKPISEMTPEELAATTQALEAALQQALHKRAEAARPILDVTPDPAANTSETDPFA